MDYEFQLLRQKLEEAGQLEGRLVRNVEGLNEKLGQSENRYIALIENENELRNEVSKFKATLRDSKGNMMLLENELESAKSENNNMSNVVDIVLNDQEKLLTLINFWHGEYLGRYVKGIIENDNSRKQLQAMISLLNEMINLFEQKRGMLAQNLDNVDLSELDEKLNDLISNQIKVMTNEYVC